MSSTTQTLGRGTVAGMVGGAAAGLFGLVVAEPTLDRAVRLEAGAAPVDAHADSHAAGTAAAEEVFTRGEQHAGLLLGSVLAGVAFGLLLALVLLLVRWRAGRDSTGIRNGAGGPGGPGAPAGPLALAASAYAIWLLTFLRYPANPPGVGDADTVGTRVSDWLAALLLSAVVVLVAWYVHGALVARGAPAALRHLAAVAVPTAGLALLFLVLGDNRDPVEAPAELLWDFRLHSLASMALLWAGLGFAFAVLEQRATSARGRRLIAQRAAGD